MCNGEREKSLLVTGVKNSLSNISYFVNLSTWWKARPICNVLFNKNPILISEWLSMCARCVLECSGPCRESDGAGFPPGSPACGASHWETHPVWGSVGLPWPCSHHCCFAQLQRPFLHTSGRASCSQTWKLMSAATHTQTYCCSAPFDFFQCKVSS